MMSGKMDALFSFRNETDNFYTSEACVEIQSAETDALFLFEIHTLDHNGHHKITTKNTASKADFGAVGGQAWPPARSKPPPRAWFVVGFVPPVSSVVIFPATDFDTPLYVYLGSG